MIFDLVFQLLDLVGLLLEALRGHYHPLVSDIGQRGRGKACMSLVDREADIWEHMRDRKGAEPQGCSM